MVGNGEYLPITHTGSTSLASTSGMIPVSDVLVCPKIAKSLLSVSKITSDYPCSVDFDCDNVRIYDKATKRLLLQGPHTSGLYSLQSSPPQVFYSNRQISASDELWHQRLGHPNPLVLQQLSTNKAIFISKSSKTICEACHLGKSSRLPFFDSSFVATRPLERVHCDLWGPSPVSSIQGFRFYVVFIDHYTRYSWFYPLRNKSDFYEIFLMFQALAQNICQEKICTFECDGGGEFISHKFLNHLELHGIQQHLSCPHTPQQNGLAERKHR